VVGRKAQGEVHVTGWARDGSARVVGPDVFNQFISYPSLISILVSKRQNVHFMPLPPAATNSEQIETWP
jgi:hypothetical protein